MGKKTRKTRARIAAAAGMALAAGAANAITIDGGEGIGDLVWVDTNMNGIQDGGEAGLAGVTVNLLYSNLTFHDTTVTDASGLYEFWFSTSSLGNHDFIIEFVLPTGYSFSPQNVGGDDTLDSDADTITGRTGLIHINGDYGQDEFDNTVDAGMYRTLVPLPAAVWLFGSGLLGLIGIAKRKTTKL
ncbi:MAG: SdrD B-like domain-containing protein [Pseudomonadota bacterium]